jgi:hypothetical protein
VGARGGRPQHVFTTQKAQEKRSRHTPCAAAVLTPALSKARSIDITPMRIFPAKNI